MPDPSGTHVVALTDVKRSGNAVSTPLEKSIVTRWASRVALFRTPAEIRLPSGDHDGVMKKPGAKNSGGCFVATAWARDPSVFATTSELSPWARSTR